jgi:L-asparagine transporter-like permease
MDIKIVVLVALIVTGFMLVAVVAGKKSAGSIGLYKRGKLMTENELEFFGRLINAMPNHYIFPQVSMGALLEASSRDKKQAHSDRLRIAQQRVDYVVCDSTGAIVVVVELDDRTHSSAKDRTRDERLMQADIRTVRFQSKDKPTPQAIAAACLPSPVMAQASPIARSQ